MLWGIALCASLTTQWLHNIRSCCEGLNKKLLNVVIHTPKGYYICSKKSCLLVRLHNVSNSISLLLIKTSYLKKGKCTVIAKISWRYSCKISEWAVPTCIPQGSNISNKSRVTSINHWPIILATKYKSVIIYNCSILS